MKRWWKYVIGGRAFWADLSTKDVMGCAHKNRVVVSTKPYVERCEGCGMVRTDDKAWQKPKTASRTDATMRFKASPSHSTGT